ncbi:MAG: arylesterase [Bacteroidota bacterium]
MSAKLLIPVFLLFLLSACGSGEPSEQKPAASTAPQIGPAATEKASTQNILFFGNSLTAAYGLEPSEGFVGLIQERLDTLKLPFKAINAGLSGETTAGGLTRIDWILERQTIDIFVLELGGNDGLRGIDPAASAENLQGIIDKVKAKYPEVKIIIAGMEAPPNMGQQFTENFRGIFPRLAEANASLLIPFLLEGVGGIPELNQADGIHPTKEGHRILAENIWKVLRGLVKK